MKGLVVKAVGHPGEVGIVAAIDAALLEVLAAGAKPLGWGICLQGMEAEPAVAAASEAGSRAGLPCFGFERSPKGQAGMVAWAVGEPMENPFRAEAGRSSWLVGEREESSVVVGAASEAKRVRDACEALMVGKGEILSLRSLGVGADGCAVIELPASAVEDARKHFQRWELTIHPERRGGSLEVEGPEACEGKSHPEPARPLDFASGDARGEALLSLLQNTPHRAALFDALDSSVTCRVESPPGVSEVCTFFTDSTRHAVSAEIVSGNDWASAFCRALVRSSATAPEVHATVVPGEEERDRQALAQLCASSGLSLHLTTAPLRTLLVLGQREGPGLPRGFRQPGDAIVLLAFADPSRVCVRATAGLPLSTLSALPDGGLAQALAEACLTKLHRPMGAQVRVGDPALLFDSLPGALLATLPTSELASLRAFAPTRGFQVTELGTVGGTSLHIDGMLEVSCTDMMRALTLRHR